MAEITNLQRLENFINKHKGDFEETSDDGCSNNVNDLSIPYKKKLDIIKDVLRGEFHNRKVDEGDSFVPTNYNQLYAYYRTYHQLGDIDTKNISLYSTTTRQLWRVKLPEIALKKHFLQIDYAKFIDKASRKTAAYGNYIVKMVDGEPLGVHPLNIFFDNTAGDVQKTSYVEKYLLQYHEAIERYPDFKDEIDVVYNDIAEDGYNEIQFMEFWSWFEFKGKVRKGAAVFLDKSYEAYPNCDRLKNRISSILEEGGHYDSYVEVDTFESPYWKRDIFGKKKEQLFPYVISEAFPVDDDIRAQGIIEILLPLAARFNQLMERLDRLMNSSLSGVKIHEFEAGFESGYSEDDLRNMKPDEFITLVKDKQDVKAIVDQSVIQESTAILRMIDFIKNLMNEISGVTSFALSAELNQSAKATTSAAITTASQTPFKKFIERMTEFHKSIIIDFMLPHLIDRIDDAKVVAEDISVQERQQIILEAAEAEVNRNWEKFDDKVWNARKKAAKDNPGVVVHGATEEDRIDEVQKIIKKWEAKPISFFLGGDWAWKLQLNATIDIDNEFADKERKFNKLMQLSSLPMVQQVTRAEEIVLELLKNADVDGYSFIKSRAEQMEDTKRQQEMEIFKNEVAQQVASQEGDQGVLGGRPKKQEELTKKIEAKVGETTEASFDEAIE